MNLYEFLTRRPVPVPDHYWRSRVPEMRLDEHMENLHREIGKLDRHDFVEHPRDLDYGRTIPETPDLFADGLEIAQSVLDWEEKAGQSITPLLEHIKAAQQLRKSVTAKAEGSEAEANAGAPQVET